MRHLLSFQALLHMPALSFLLMLAAAVLLLPQEELPPPLPLETVASDITWSRHTAAGETVHLSAHHLQRQTDGIVNLQEVIIKIKQQQNDVYLRGNHGVTDNTYQKISLTDANAELITPTGERVTLSLTSALYHLDGNRLQGKSVNISQHDNNLAGNTFVWDNKNMLLRGDVRASYALPAGR